MEFIHEQARPGMTVLAPDINDATGEAITEADVVDTRIANLITNEDRDPLPDELMTEEEAEYIADLSPEDLVTIHDEILNQEYEYSPDTANLIAQADIGSSPADVTVKYLASKFYLGDLTAEEAFSQAIESGLAESELVYAFNKLKIATRQ